MKHERPAKAIFVTPNTIPYIVENSNFSKEELFNDYMQSIEKRHYCVMVLNDGQLSDDDLADVAQAYVEDVCIYFKVDCGTICMTHGYELEGDDVTSSCYRKRQYESRSG